MDIAVHKSDLDRGFMHAKDLFGRNDRATRIMVLSGLTDSNAQTEAGINWIWQNAGLPFKNIPLQEVKYLQRIGDGTYGEFLCTYYYDRSADTTSKTQIANGQPHRMAIEYWGSAGLGEASWDESNNTTAFTVADPRTKAAYAASRRIELSINEFGIPFRVSSSPWNATSTAGNTVNSKTFVILGKTFAVNTLRYNGIRVASSDDRGSSSRRYDHVGEYLFSERPDGWYDYSPIDVTGTIKCHRTLSYKALDWSTVTWPY